MSSCDEREREAEIAGDDLRPEVMASWLKSAEKSPSSIWEMACGCERLLSSV